LIIINIYDKNRTKLVLLCVQKFLPSILSSIFYNNTYSQDTSQDELRKLFSAMRIIDYAYVDSVDNHHLIEQAITAMLKELDPHSVYFSKEEIIAAYITTLF